MDFSALFNALGWWDLALVIMVTTGGTLAAYIPHPRWKAFILATPVPFSFAVMALGQPVNATNVTALLVLLAYTFAVRILYYRLQVPIVAAIVLSAVGYCGVGGALALIIPKTEQAFLAASVSVAVVGAVLHSAMPIRIEDGAKSPLPVWKKILVIAAAISFLTIVKTILQGFMTVFPMLGVVVSYESRASLHAVTRHIPIIILGLVPMMTTMYLLQDFIGLGFSLLAGWGVYLAVLPLFLIPLWRKYNEALNKQELAA